MCFLVSRAAIFTTNFRQKAIWGWKTVYANKNWWGTLCISTGKAEQCREGLRTNALPYSTRSVVGSRHCYFLQQNPPTWINGAILEIMTISKRQSVVSAGSHEHKIDLSCRGRRSDMNFLCLNRLGLVDPRTYKVGVVCNLYLFITKDSTFSQNFTCNQKFHI